MSRRPIQKLHGKATKGTGKGSSALQNYTVGPLIPIHVTKQPNTGDCIDSIYPVSQRDPMPESPFDPSQV